jgi:hypothetical protein
MKNLIQNIIFRVLSHPFFRTYFGRIVMSAIMQFASRSIKSLVKKIPVHVIIDYVLVIASRLSKLTETKLDDVGVQLIKAGNKIISQRDDKSGREMVAESLEALASSFKDYVATTESKADDIAVKLCENAAKVLRNESENDLILIADSLDAISDTFEKIVIESETQVDDLILEGIKNVSVTLREIAENSK